MRHHWTKPYRRRAPKVPGVSQYGMLSDDRIQESLDTASVIMTMQRDMDAVERAFNPPSLWTRIKNLWK